MKAPRHVSHDEVVVDMLKADPQMADVYLATALEEANLPGGQFALLTAQRHIAEAKGMVKVAENAGIALHWLNDKTAPTGPEPKIKTRKRQPF